MVPEAYAEEAKALLTELTEAELAADWIDEEPLEEEPPKS